MYQNVRLMDVINECNVIDQLDIVGVYMKTPAKIYPEHQSKTADQIVQTILLDPWKDVPNRKKSNFWKN